MTSTDQKNRNDIIEFATILYGAGWREQLAKTLGTPRRNLDRWLTASAPLPSSIVLGIVNQMRTHLEAQRRAQDELDRRVTHLHRQIATPIRRAATEESRAEQAVVPLCHAELRVVEQAQMQT